MKFWTVLCIIFLSTQSRNGLEYNKNYNTNFNTDFLLHESGSKPTAPKRDNVAWATNTNVQTNGNNNNNYNSQFPQLGSTHNNQPNTNQQPAQSNGKRDYVAPQFTTMKPTSSQTLTQATRNPSHNPSSSTRNVTPIPSTTKAVQINQQTTGKVKDLINFYDGKAKGPNSPQGAPSYSSILQGTGNNNFPSLGTSGSTKVTQSFTQTTPKPPSTKPFSYSSILSGPNKPVSTPSVLTTPKPSTRVPVLPSSILNNNRNTGSSSQTVTDVELQSLSEDLLRKDSNNAAKYITINYQEKTTSQSKEDKAPLPLLTVSSAVWNIPTIEKFVPLLDNYERDTLVNEHVTPQERNEENAFMDAVMATTVMRHLMNFLKDKGYVTPDPKQQRDFVKQLWFSLYSRGRGKISSSGFEHIFVSELKHGEVSGLHNWVYFSKEEAMNRINYLGYLKYRQFGEKGAVIKFHFTQQGVDKPVNSMFIGTSPELEMALYTLCFVTRADNECNLKLASNDVSITTHTFRYRSKNLIGSAYPQI